MWEQRQRTALLEGRAALERTSESLMRSERIANETEEIGTSVVRELGVQRETLQRTQGRLEDIESELSQSRKIMNFMRRRVFMNKILLALTILAEIGILACLVYIKFLR